MCAVTVKKANAKEDVKKSGSVTVKKGKAVNSDQIVVNNLHVTSPDRTRKEIKDFQLARKMAEYIHHPIRAKLFDLMEEVLVDAHLTGIIGKRLRAVRNKAIQFVKNDKPVDAMSDLIGSKEFRRLRKYIFNKEMWGLTGLEFLIAPTLQYKAIPRKHIKPDLGRITIHQLGNEGYDYTTMPNIWILQTDEEDNNFGLLLKAIPWVIYKRCNVGDFAQFIELFGQPPRVGKYDAGDIETRRIMEEIMDKAGASLGVVIPKTADLEFKDVKAVSGDGKLHKTMHDICDEQLSILILGQTETTKSSDSSGYAQSKTHAAQQLEITKDDMDNELEALNDPFFVNILKSYNYPVEGGKFIHVDEADPAQLKARLEIDKEVAQIVPVADDYFYETYNVPKPDNYEELKAQKEARQAIPPPRGKEARNGKKNAQGDDPEEEVDEDVDDTEDLSDASAAQLFKAGFMKMVKSLSGFFLAAPAKPGLSMTDLAGFYNTRCGVCGGYHVPDLAGAGDGLDKIVEDIATELYNRRLKDGMIPDELYHATADKLMAGIFSGMGGKSFGYEDNRNELRAYLEHNIYAFSAAKSLTELREFRSLMVGKDGKIRSEIEFRNACVDAGKVFNKNYLSTEYHSALASAQTAAQWAQFGDDEYLEINTAGDDKVRPSHQILDKFTAKKSDPVWRRLCPPFDWECRCILVPGVAANVRGIDKGQLIKDAQIPKYFQRNPGITKVVFDQDHPYYINSYGKETELSAEAVYGMPSVPHLYEVNDFPLPVEFDSKEAANAWWKDKAGTAKGSFDAVDYNGLTVRFDNTFRKHVFEANQESRYLHVANTEDIIKNPDEVWSQREKGVVKRFYLKYYNDFPYVVRVDGADAYTMHNFENKGKLNEPSINRLRRGVLLYRKN